LPPREEVNEPSPLIIECQVVFMDYGGDPWILTKQEQGLPAPELSKTQYHGHGTEVIVSFLQDSLQAFTTKAV
jgi:hypothetical protein